MKKRPSSIISRPFGGPFSLRGTTTLEISDWITNTCSRAYRLYLVGAYNVRYNGCVWTVDIVPLIVLLNALLTNPDHCRGNALARPCRNLGVKRTAHCSDTIGRSCRKRLSNAFEFSTTIILYHIIRDTRRCGTERRTPTIWMPFSYRGYISRDRSTNSYSNNPLIVCSCIEVLT